MGERPRHPRKELEAVIREAERRGWRASRSRLYYVMLCPCGAHRKSVHLTPSDPGYERNLRGWLRRATCWDSEV